MSGLRGMMGLVFYGRNVDGATRILADRTQKMILSKEEYERDD